ncbi:hypothetical protein Tco_0656275 [Tanacetum coccineum]|uniref:Uncharacterized protein n=1 Tax=Tanacetum coccineum TaxID=301880 RepID=A0ABQ4X8J2_9ASTR
MSSKYQVTKEKDMETEIPLYFRTQPTVEERKKRRLWFFTKWRLKISDRFVAPCFVNGLEAYDGGINLGVEENMISHEFAVKLCVEHEVKIGNKVVKKELIVALRGEIYFVKFIINPEEDDVKPGVVFGRSFLRLTKRSRQYETVEEAGTNEVIFTSVAWIRAFNINEPIYSKLCHEFYSTYKFDEVCANDELKTKKIIKFRLGGRAHSLTLLEFARRLGLYHAEVLDKEGFDVYFQGGTSFEGVAQDDHLWLVSKDNWMDEKKSSWYSERESSICCGQFITKLARKARVLSDEVIRSLSALIYCRDLDTTTPRELIKSEGRSIPEDPHPDVPRVAIPRA